MTNPTEITNIILVEITNITEMTNTITNVVTNVLDKIDIVSVDKLPTDLVSFLGAVGTIAISVVLWWLNDRKEKAEKEERLLKDDREFIQKFIDTRLEMPYWSEYKNYELKECEDFIDDIEIELHRLNLITIPTKYKYLSDYIEKIIPIIQKYNNADDFPLYSGFITGSIYMITRYMYIGEETFNEVWEEEFKRIEKGFEENIENRKKQKKRLEKDIENLEKAEKILEKRIEEFEVIEKDLEKAEKDLEKRIEDNKKQSQD